ncbi:MAG: hypothetical protein OEW39_13100, partial [Deltaproteobacteria bacterium]|nr:hypothetical protein [Deltaproteobacteria bacterium]
RMGFPEGARAEPQGFAVVALGKLGSQEMRFSSDLDLVFLYRGEGRTDQGRSHYEFYTRLGQTLGNLLTSQTQFGRLYELDHRLRPFGTRSVLVPSLKAYEDFFSPEETGGAEIWNYQAFTRARFLCGEAALARDLMDRVAHTWQARHLTPEAVATAVQTMMERLVTQSAPNLPPGEEPALSLKFATGGLIGFEFLRQAHFLCARLTGPPLWEPPEPAPNLVEGLTDYESLGALDERLSFYIPRYGNRVRRSELERLAALRDRWHWDDVRRVWERMEARVIAGFQTLRG